MNWMINAIGDTWATLLAAYIVLSIAVGIIQHLRGKELWETKAFGVMGVLYFAWTLPLALPLFVLYWILKWGWRQFGSGIRP